MSGTRRPVTTMKYRSIHIASVTRTAAATIPPTVLVAGTRAMTIGAISPPRR
jgi:hypothetical protein